MSEQTFPHPGQPHRWVRDSTPLVSAGRRNGRSQGYTARYVCTDCNEQSSAYIGY